MSPERALRKVDDSNTTNTKTGMPASGWRTPTGYLFFAGHFPQKNPRISGVFAQNDLQLENDLDAKASYGSFILWVFATLYSLLTSNWQKEKRRGEKPDV